MQLRKKPGMATNTHSRKPDTAYQTLLLESLGSRRGYKPCSLCIQRFSLTLQKAQQQARAYKYDDVIFRVIMHL